MGIRDVVNRVTYLEAESPQDDPLVAVGASIADWQAGLPGLTVTKVATRHGDWHIRTSRRS